jgi:hypothetical protein
MCLSKITKQLKDAEFDATKNEERKAWKVFTVVRGHHHHADWQLSPLYRWQLAPEPTSEIYGEYFSLVKPYFVGKWAVAEERPLTVREDSGLIWYWSGFHCFTSRSDAEKWLEADDNPGIVKVVLPVKVRGVHTEGMQYFRAIEADANGGRYPRSEYLPVIVAKEMMVLSEDPNVPE